METATEDLKVVLNGGSDVMESATIPTQWFVSGAAAAKAPTHLLVVDYKDNEFNDYCRAYLGRRYVVPVTDRIMYLQFTRAGVHHLCFIALSLVDLDEKEKRYYIDKLLAGSDGSYNKSIVFDESGMLPRVGGHYDVAGKIVKIEVPKEFFAERPQGAIAKAFHTFVNGSVRGGLVDECHNRRRWLTVFPLKLLFYVPFRAVLTAGLNAFALIFGGLTFFCGYRPVGFVEQLKKDWNFNYPFKEAVKEGSFDTPYGHRVWRKNDDGTVVKMPVALWQVCLPVLAAFGVYHYYFLIVGNLSMILYCVLGVAGVSVLLWNVASLGRLAEHLFGYLGQILAKIVRMMGEEEPNETQKAKVVEEYRGWLMTELAATKAPVKVDLKHLPKPFKHDGALELKIAYGALKARVCKPYAR